jgi:creatinine amidohydrolase
LEFHVMHDDIFANTMAEMTWQEAEEAAAGGAVALWALGVIEQHGPHLPTGTDVYLPSARLRRARQLLAQRGIASIIVPPFFWGINGVSASYPASFVVRPAIMIELMLDVFSSLARDGYRRVFCVTGHGEALHNSTLFEGVRRGAANTGMDISFAADEGLLARLRINPADPCVTAYRLAQDNTTMPDIHAGAGETSQMLALYPGLVKQTSLASLSPVAFTVADLAEWRQGYDVSRRKTPLGYVGNPAKASASVGAQDFEANAHLLADAIAQRVRPPTPR